MAGTLFTKVREIISAISPERSSVTKYVVPGIRPPRVTLCAFVVLSFIGWSGGCSGKTSNRPSLDAPPKAAIDMTIQVYGPVESQRDWTNSLREKLISDIRSGITERKPDTSDMIKIPAGKAIIGCEDSPDACLPFQTRNIGAFYIDRDEVTNAEYNRCVAEKQCLPPTNFPHMPGSSEPDHPALLTFKQAERYCLWAGKRLPTEYEWEKAARGKDGRLYPWGNDAPLKPVANVCGAECTMNWADPTWSDGYAYTAPVGRFPEDRSPYGLLDVAGNVKEWVASVAPLPQYHFIARGGSWYTKREQLRAWERQEWRQGIRLDDKGVRCAADGRGPIKKSATRPR